MSPHTLKTKSDLLDEVNVEVSKDFVGSVVSVASVRADELDHVSRHVPLVLGELLGSVLGMVVVPLEHAGSLHLELARNRLGARRTAISWALQRKRVDLLSLDLECATFLQTFL